MAWRYLARAVETGVVIDPRDFVMNQTEFAAEFNGLLDRDNIATSALTEDDFEPQTLVAVWWTIAEPAGGATEIHTIAEGAGGSWEEVEDATTTITVDDGELIVDANLCGGFVRNAAAVWNQKWQSRLLINGNVVANTGWTHECRKLTAVAMTGSASVSAGSATIQIQVRAWSDLYYHLPTYGNGTASAGAPGFEYVTNHEFTLQDVDFQYASLCIVHRKH